MTPEDRERNDRIDRELESIREINRTTADQIARNSESIARNSEQIARHSEEIALIGRGMGELQDLVLRLGRVVEEQSRTLSRTDERLNILISVVERYFSDGRH